MMNNKNDPVDEKRRACIVLGVLFYINQLVKMDDATYETTVSAWSEHRFDDPAWSEGMVVGIKGRSAEALISTCQKIAVLAFVPGGVRLFSTLFIAKRDRYWCAWKFWVPMRDQALALIREDYDREVGRRNKVRGANE